METGKLFLVLAVIIFAPGCQSFDTVKQNYQMVKYNDGVNMQEAKAIAQQSMTDSPYTSSYDIFHPRLVLGEATKKYQNFWFVTFSSKDPSSMYEHVVVV